MKLKKVTVFGLEYYIPEKEFFFYEKHFLSKFDAYEVEDIEETALPGWLSPFIKVAETSSQQEPCDECGKSKKGKKKSVDGGKATATGTGKIEEPDDSGGDGGKDNTPDEHTGKEA